MELLLAWSTNNNPTTQAACPWKAERKLIKISTTFLLYLWLCGLDHGNVYSRSQGPDDPMSNKLTLALFQPPQALPSSNTGRCPDPTALDLFKNQIAYERTEESDPLKGLTTIRLDVLMRGRITGFYVHDQLKGTIADLRMVYVFDKSGQVGGGTCSGDEKWSECVANFIDPQPDNNISQSCSFSLDTRTIPPWKPSPDTPKKRKVANELRQEIEVQWRDAKEIVIRDFNLKDPQITFYIKMPDDDYFLGCGFNAEERPHCTGWHAFGQVPSSSMRKWIFEKPYRLK